MYDYEEIILVNKTSSKELEKYDVDQNLKLYEQISIILRNGDEKQRSSILRNFPELAEDERVIEVVLCYFIENKDLISEGLSIELAESFEGVFNVNNKSLNIEKLAINFAKYINNLLCVIISYLEKSMDNSELRNSFSSLFNNIAEFHRCTRKIDLSKTIIDKIKSLGSFGQKVYFRRLSTYFAASLIPIVNNNSELVSNLSKLSSDYENPIRRELSYQLKFLLKEMSDDYILSNLLQVIETYLNDRDIVLICETCIAIISNLEKIIKLKISILKLAISKLEAIIKDNDKTETLIILNVFSLLLKVMNSETTLNEIRLFDSIIKQFFQVFFESLTNIDFSKIEFLIVNYEYYSNLLNQMREYNLLETLSDIIMFYVFDNPEQKKFEIPYNVDNKIGDYKHEILMKMKTLFYSNFLKLLLHTSNDIKNNVFLPKLFCVFSDEYCPMYKPILDNLQEIAKNEIKSNKKEFTNSFYAQIYNIESFLEHNFDWRFFLNFINTLKEIDTPIDFIDLTKSICLKHLNKSRNLKLEQGCIKLYAKLIKVCPNTDEKKNMFTYVENNYLKSNSFYKRRLFIDFSEEVFNSFSFQFTWEHKVVTNLLSLLSYPNFYYPRIIDHFRKYIPLIEQSNSKTKDEIYSTIKAFGTRKDLCRDTISSCSRFWFQKDHYSPNFKISKELINLNECKLQEETKLLNQEKDRILNQDKFDNFSRPKGKTLTTTTSSVSKEGSSNNIRNVNIKMNTQKVNSSGPESSRKEKVERLSQLKLSDENIPAVTGPKINSTRGTPTNSGFQKSHTLISHNSGSDKNIKVSIGKQSTITVSSTASTHKSSFSKVSK